MADFDDTTNSITIKKDGKLAVNRLDLEQQLTENLCYVKPHSSLLNIKELREYQRKESGETYEYIHALVVIEDSPIYQIEFVLNKVDLLLVEEEWFIYKVYQNYGGHKV